MEYRIDRSPYKLNFYLNHSSIYPNIAPDGAGYIDASDVLEDPETKFFNFGHGGVLFIPFENCHKLDAYFIKKHGAKRLIKASIDYMFGLGVKNLIAEVPSFNKPSRFMVSSLGFERSGVSGSWIKNGTSYNVIQYKLENQWAV